MNELEAKLMAVKAIISNPDGQTAREGMVQAGECPPFNRDELHKALALGGEDDLDLNRAVLILLHLSKGSGVSYKAAKWAVVQALKRLSVLKRRRTAAFQKALRLGYSPNELRGMPTELILAMCEDEVKSKHSA